ncbi:helix-turn-helix domain-containing protein [Enterococcus gilvus]|uniref:helix-turn-helix domain-containing protein n=1 Tax=Enterococcus gilvus TaxID=160453 RepID=UPI003EDB3754
MNKSSSLFLLIVKAQQGNEEAMTELILKFDSLIIKLSKNYGGIFDEDCYQILAERL